MTTLQKYTIFANRVSAALIDGGYDYVVLNRFDTEQYIKNVENRIDGDYPYVDLKIGTLSTTHASSCLNTDITYEINIGIRDFDYSILLGIFDVIVSVIMAGTAFLVHNDTDTVITINNVVP